MGDIKDVRLEISLIMLVCSSFCRSNSDCQTLRFECYILWFHGWCFDKVVAVKLKLYQSFEFRLQSDILHKVSIRIAHATHCHRK